MVPGCAMLMSKDNQAAYLEKVGSLPLGSTLNRGLLNSVVKLSGSTSEGSTFTGSAVIAYVEDGTVTLVSAKHNLYIYAEKEDPPEWDEELATTFRDNVTIVYDSPMRFNLDPGRKAAISAVKPIVQKDENPWAYDVMILESTDANLAVITSIFPITDLKRSPTDLGYLLDEKRYLKRDGQTFIQFGYGKNRETAQNRAKTLMPEAKVLGTNLDGCLQFRVCEPLATKKVTVYGERTDDPKKYDPAIDAIQVSADPTSSSAPGDSGGPLFVVTRLSDVDRLFLIGVTYGADLAAAETPCPSGGKLRVNNIVSSLAYCYRSGLLGY
jgi:hypothetical protein